MYVVGQPALLVLMTWPGLCKSCVPPLAARCTLWQWL
jgi:hypothetical protein